jgi:hypothetical protein
VTFAFDIRDYKPFGASLFWNGALPKDGKLSVRYIPLLLKKIIEEAILGFSCRSCLKARVFGGIC